MLENRLLEETEEPGLGKDLPRAFLARLAAATPTPGGGSASALAGAMAAALTRMVANLTLARR
ncbi:MAG: cyclodeaminase/cyclohydrolase family protein, partial [Chloroflexia bacterium]